MSNVPLAAIVVISLVGVVLIIHSLSAPGTSYGEILARVLGGGR